MDQELVDEIENVFADYEVAEELISEGDVETMFAFDLKCGDVVEVMGNEYVIAQRKKYVHFKTKHVKFIMNLKGFGFGLEDNQMSITVSGTDLIKARRIQ